MKAFILGAGFSKQAGLPLATELTELLTAKFRQIKDDDAIMWFDCLERRIQRVSQDRAVGIEEVFHYAQFDIEIWKMKQQLCPVGRLNGNTPWNTAEGIEAILSNMEYDLVLKQANAVCFLKVGRTNFFSAVNSCQPIAA